MWHFIYVLSQWWNDGGGGGVGPTPDVTDDNRGLIGSLVVRGGVGRRGGRG